MRLFLFIICLLPFALMGQETEVFLIGDAGEPHFPNDATLDYLKEVSAQAGPEDVMIFLGDNLYPKGPSPQRRCITRRDGEKAQCQP